MAGRTCVVTGGSLGIGAAITRGLLALGAEVVVGCRDVARAEARRGELAPAGAGHRLRVERLDVASPAEVAAFGARIAARHPVVHALVNNAGASFPRRRTAGGLEATFAVNVLGGFAVTRALRPLLARAEGQGRVVHVGSAAQYLRPLRVDRLLDPPRTYVHVWVYAHTKRAQFELSERWAEALDEEGVTSVCAHPGLVDTPGVAEAFPRYHRLFGPALSDPAEGADGVVWLASAPEAAGLTGGLWWRRARQPADLVPWTRSRPGERDRLWRTCERLVPQAS